MSTISLLGCGWLGTPLANRLSASGYSVKVSSSTQRLFSNETLSPYVIRLPECIDSHFFDCQVLIIMVPFKRRFLDPSQYLDMIMSIHPYISTKIKQIIFTSSTMVYQATNQRVNEDSPIDDGDRAQVLTQVERFLLDLPAIKTTILRLGGLYGPHRDIGQFALKKKVIMGNHPVNLIHQDDCIAIISALLKQPYHGILNAVGNAHPTRYDLYHQVLDNTSLSQIKFVNDPTLSYKIVDNTKLKRLLNFKFKNDLPF
jgi:nucleoside-diphosphate-sugar epimerase